MGNNWILNFYALALCLERSLQLRRFREDTTRNATVTGYKSNPVWRKDGRQGSYSSVGGVF
jgi:hypothetical protein